ncbi:hypothetical protein IWQ60_010824 [Tieghemiomyces parasiticus]|uniref:Uncharacterized protein n=1 Tax=Tieghemiomyces parasiticus TaxID=78921 RepID=A0A9W8DN14_9FUNG|nr:hypothetical protein IWQ60_010824 [Tieghemiomyces parasiticus]
MPASEALVHWDVNKVYAWFCSLGFQAYEKQIRDNQITGEVLLHLHHDALHDLSIESLGKRLVILKAIYQLKVQHRIPFTSDDYIPPDVEGIHNVLLAPAAGVPRDGSGRPVSTATQHEEMFNQVEGLLEEQEMMITHLQQEVTRLTRTVTRLSAEFDRLREDVGSVGSGMPIAVQQHGRYHRGPEGHATSTAKTPSPGHSHPAPTIPGADVGYGGKRPAPIKTKVLGSPKHVLSGQYAPSAVSLHTISNCHNLSPMTLVGSNGSGSAIPASPSSPSEYFNYKTHTFQDISYLKRSGSLPSSEHVGRTTYGHGNGYGYSTNVTTNSSGSGGGRSSKHRSVEKIATPPATTPLEANGDCVIRVFGDKGIRRENESYKTFRVSADDPCHKILPQALKKYSIFDDWRNYSLCIMCGTSEHRLQNDDKPLHLFQKLHEANASPYFMLKSLRLSPGDDH